MMGEFKYVMVLISVYLVRWCVVQQNTVGHGIYTACICACMHVPFSYKYNVLHVCG